MARGQANQPLRPGIATGPYPERRLRPQSSWLEQGFRPLGSLYATVWYRCNRQRFIAAVNRAEHSFKVLDTGELAAQGRKLGYRLRLEGLTLPHTAQAFALVREAAQRTLALRHFDVQLLGGWVLLQGKVAEMETGEGKTLTATLPACTAALAGIPVHIITVNDYLASRDAALMAPLYESLGLRVGVIQTAMDASARRDAYGCDIVYCTNKQLAFDYLRDQLTLNSQGSWLQLQTQRLHHSQPSTQLLRGLCFGLVDEADSVLIDEARTPLLLSQETPAASQQTYYSQALALARQLQAGTEFKLHRRDRSVELSAHGKDRLQTLAQPLGGVWQASRRREELVCQALRALHLYQRDRDYLVSAGQVQIIDEFTGRVMADRTWENGLHQLIETKEGCSLTGQKETLARISYQQFFRRYLRLAGMTGTAHEVRGELSAVYGLQVVKIPTQRPCKRVQHRPRIYRTRAEKWQAVVQQVHVYHSQGRALLLGTRSLAASEQLSQILAAAGLPHQVLNARQDAQEAAIIARAGEPGRITVATNMAGRGTDIRLAAGVAHQGGLHVIATERHEASRIDRQLVGRCARQGDPGSVSSILSLEDELIALYCPNLMRQLAGCGGATFGFGQWLNGLAFALAQRAAERHHRRLRRALLKQDEHLDTLLAFAGRSL